MTLFGKEVEIEEEQIKYILGGVLILITILLVVFLIIPKVADLKTEYIKLGDTKKKLEEKVKEKQTVDQQLKDRWQQYQTQQVNLAELIEKFKGASLRDDTDLKIVIQNLINRLGLKSSEIARAEITEQTRTKSDGTVETLYTKVYVPYKLRGDFTRIGRLLYYLENSKWLLTFNGSDLKIVRVEEKEKQYIDVIFKVGGYTNINSEAMGLTSAGAVTVLPAINSVVR